MKKFILAAALGLSLTFPGFSGSALAQASNVGFVDTQKIFESSKLAEALNSAKKELATMEEDIKKDTLNKSKQLEDARAKKVADAEIKKMQENFTKEIENKRKDGQVLTEKKQKELEDMSKKLKVEVEDAIKSVAKDKKLDVVVDRQAVLFGGTDITEDVIKTLNKK